MAEIHVQAKKQSSTSTWLWIVLALMIVGAVVYYLMTRNQSPTNNVVQPTSSTKVFPAKLSPQSRPPRPQRVETVIPIVYMRSV